MTSAWRPIPPVGPCPSIPANNLVRTSGRINKISNKIACCALNHDDFGLEAYSS